MKSRKLNVLFLFVLLLALAGNASANSLLFYPPNDGTTGNWSDGNNWLVDGVWTVGQKPTSSDVVSVRDPGRQATLNTSEDCLQLLVGHENWSTNNVLDVYTGGNLTVHSTWGHDQWGILLAYAGEGTINMHGGTINIAEVQLGIGGTATGDGEFNMLGSDAYLYAGGAVSVDPFNAAGSAVLNANAGLIDAGWLSIGSNGLIDITEGVIEVRNDVAGFITDWIASNQITAYGGTGTVVYDYGVTKEGVTTIRAEVPEPATIAVLGIGALLLRRKRT